MRIILDTGVLFRREAMRDLALEVVPAVLPAIAYAERARQLEKAGRDVDGWTRNLDEWGVRIEPFGRDEASRLRGFPALLDDEQWRRLARDAFIAAHVGPADEIWTTNPKDFLALGLQPAQVVTIG